MPSATNVLIGIAVLVAAVLVSALIFMLLYNYAVADGVSGGKLQHLDYPQALAFMVLIGMFLSPTVIVSATKMNN